MIINGGHRLVRADNWSYCGGICRRDNAREANRSAVGEDAKLVEQRASRRRGAGVRFIDNKNVGQNVTAFPVLPQTSGPQERAAHRPQRPD